MIDLDDFKRLNDRLGHLAGDRALVHLLTVLQVALRPTDVVARIGGEEFAILFAATDGDEAAAATVRVQAELAARADEAMYRAKRAGKNRVERGARGRAPARGWCRPA